MNKNENPVVMPELTDKQRQRLDSLVGLRHSKIEHVKNIKMSALLATAVIKSIDDSMQESDGISMAIGSETELAMAHKSAMQAHYHLLRDISASLRSADPADAVGLGIHAGMIPYAVFTGMRYWNNDQNALPVSCKPSTALAAAPKHVRDGIDEFCARIFAGCPVARCTLRYITQCVLQVGNDDIDEMVRFAVDHKHQSLQGMCNFVMHEMSFKESISAIGSLIEARSGKRRITASMDEFGGWWESKEGIELPSMFVIAKRDSKLIVWGQHGSEG